MVLRNRTWPKVWSGYSSTMGSRGWVVAEDHQVVLGADLADTLDVVDRGSLIEVGPEFFTVRTGVAHGPVEVEFAVHATDPGFARLDVHWETIEEADIATTRPLRFSTLEGEIVTALDPISPPATGRYRVRVLARGRDLNWDKQISVPTETYAFEFWPTTVPRPWQQLRKTDTVWPIPDPGDFVDTPLSVFGTPQCDLDAEDRIRARDPMQGRPHDYDVRMHWSAQMLDQLAPETVPFLESAGPLPQRAIARWAARRACSDAGLDTVDWVRASLDDLDANRLPDRRELIDYMAPESFVQRNTHALPVNRFRTLADGRDEIKQRIALGTIWSAATSDPLVAAIGSVYYAVEVAAANFPELLASIRRIRAV